MAQAWSVCSPRPFKASKTDPEQLLQYFEFYLRAMKAMFVVAKVSDGFEKRAMGIDMVWIFEHMGKVGDDDTFGQVKEKKSRRDSKASLNQVVLRQRLLPVSTRVRKILSPDMRSH